MYIHIYWMKSSRKKEKSSECIGKYERERDLILRGRFYQFQYRGTLRERLVLIYEV